MNRQGASFTISFGGAILEAIQVLEPALNDSKESSSCAAAFLPTLFFAIGLAYSDECARTLSKSETEFIVETYLYLRGKPRSGTITQKRSLLKAMKIELSGCFALNELEPDLRYVLSLCQDYDEVNGTRIRKGLSTALKRYAYHLVTVEKIQSPEKFRFYRRFIGMIKIICMIPRRPIPVRVPQTYVEPRESLEASESDSGTESNSLTILLKDIESLIGLDNIKAEVSDLVNLLRVQQMRKDAGLPSLDVTHHMVFYGNPGTGKTTIARKLSKIFMNLGLLSKGHLIETDRAGLVAGYLGQTALKTTEVLEQAKGGILFIDEAYALRQHAEHDSFGQEAIDTILKYMEDNRDDLIVIVAGYEDKMGQFIESNPGMKSRFNKYFCFSDYSSHELMMIFLKFAKEAQYDVTFHAQIKLKDACDKLYTTRGDNFGNGRTVRNFFEKCVTNQANRVVQLDSPSKEHLTQLLAEDICVDELGAEM